MVFLLSFAVNRGKTKNDCSMRCTREKETVCPHSPVADFRVQTTSVQGGDVNKSGGKSVSGRRSERWSSDQRGLWVEKRVPSVRKRNPTRDFRD